ncbi:ABC transporter permease [Kineococcus sp. R8]|uniref:permease-like cell division protein FtsX n=1 Tax=Kineococcus siccus TaxID=2696567 RepID=UPI001412F3CC|nr:ABC transporter permease [Kineococcus siccus]
MRLGFVVSEMFIGLRRNLSMTVSVVLVTMVSLFFFGAGLLVQQQVSILKGDWYDRVQVSVFLCGEESLAQNCPEGAVTAAQRDAIRTQLTTSPLVAQVFYESQADAYENFRETADESLVANITADQLPESFRVRLTDPERYEEIRAQMLGVPGVEDVPDDRKVLGPLFSALDAATLVALGLAALMLVCTVLLVSTTIRLTAFSRRRETSIMRLVGASRLLIQLPFVLEGVVATLLGAALASGALWALVEYGLGRVGDRPDFTTRLVGTQEVLTQAMPLMFAVGFLLAVVASLISLRRWLRI